MTCGQKRHDLCGAECERPPDHAIRFAVQPPPQDSVTLQLQLGIEKIMRGNNGAVSQIGGPARCRQLASRSEEHTSELQSLMRISYAVFCLTNENETEPWPKTRRSNTLYTSDRSPS